MSCSSCDRERVGWIFNTLFFMFICTCIRIWYVCMYLYKYVCVYIYIYICMCICICLSMCVYVYICVYVHVHVYVYVYVYVYELDQSFPKSGKTQIQASARAPKNKGMLVLHGLRYHFVDIKPRKAQLDRT